MRYVDLNPVRAGLVDGALEYEWSSAVAHVEGRDKWNLLDTENWREICTRGDWADALRDPIMEADQMMRLRTATQTGRPLGSDEFVEGLETRLKRPTRRRKPGPAKKSGAAAAAS